MKIHRHRREVLEARISWRVLTFTLVCAASPSPPHTPCFLLSHWVSAQRPRLHFQLTPAGPTGVFCSNRKWNPCITTTLSSASLPPTRRPPIRCDCPLGAGEQTSVISNHKTGNGKEKREDKKRDEQWEFFLRGSFRGKRGGEDCKQKNLNINHTLDGWQ